MDLPSDLIRKIATFLDPCEQAKLATCSKFLNNIITPQPVEKHHVAIKKACDMIKQTRQYPPYKISYSFAYKWTVAEMCEESFCLTIRNAGKKTFGNFSYAKRNTPGSLNGFLIPWLTKGYELSSYGETVTHIRKHLIPHLDSVKFTPEHSYKKKKIDLIVL